MNWRFGKPKDRLVASRLNEMREHVGFRRVWSAERQLRDISYAALRGDKPAEFLLEQAAAFCEEFDVDGGWVVKWFSQSIREQVFHDLLAGLAGAGLIRRKAA